MARDGLVLLLFALVVSGCSNDTPSQPPIAPPWSPPWQQPPPPPQPSLTVAQLLAAPDSLVVQGVRISVSPTLYRDYGVFDPDGSPLYGVVLLNGQPHGTLPDSVSDVYLWAIRDSSEIWSTPMKFNDFFGADSTLRYGAVNYGPNWDTGIFVDVVIGLRTSRTDVSLVLIPRVLIIRTV